MKLVKLSTEAKRIEVDEAIYVGANISCDILRGNILCSGVAAKMYIVEFGSVAESLDDASVPMRIAIETGEGVLSLEGPNAETVARFYFLVCAARIDCRSLFDLGFDWLEVAQPVAR